MSDKREKKTAVHIMPIGNEYNYARKLLFIREICE